ncbi:MAG TPA: hypothetical protein VI358_08570 [Pseudolabrys sp.]
MREIELFDENGDPIWLVHSAHGRTVDVIIIPLNPPDDEVSYRPINRMSAMDLKIAVGMDVFILGYSFGLVDAAAIR